MKKNFCKILAMALAAIMMISVSVFAAIDTPSVTDEVATVTISGLTTGEEATILVVNAGTDLATLANSDIIYIDQVTVADGAATFVLDASATAEVDGAKKVDIYSGYTSMTGDAFVLEDVVIAEAAPSFIYGDVDDSQEVNNRDKTFLARFLAGGYDVTINEAAADVDVSGEVNNRDKTFLARFLAGGYFDELPVK